MPTRTSRRVALVLNRDVLRSYYELHPVEVQWRRATRDERAMVKEYCVGYAELEGKYTDQLAQLGFAWRMNKKEAEVGRWHNPQARYNEVFMLPPETAHAAGLPLRRLTYPNTRMLAPRRSACLPSPGSPVVEDLPDPRITEDSSLCVAEHTALSNIARDAFDVQVNSLVYDVLVDRTWIDHPTPEEIHRALAEKVPASTRVCVMGLCVLPPPDSKESAS